MCSYPATNGKLDFHIYFSITQAWSQTTAVFSNVYYPGTCSWSSIYREDNKLSGLNKFDYDLLTVKNILEGKVSFLQLIRSIMQNIHVTFVSESFFISFFSSFLCQLHSILAQKITFVSLSFLIHSLLVCIFFFFFPTVNVAVQLLKSAVSGEMLVNSLSALPGAANPGCQPAAYRDINNAVWKNCRLTNYLS